MSQREPHRFDLAAALSRSLQPVDLGDFQRRNVNRVKLLRAGELATSVREAIDRALTDHRAELERARQAERKSAAECETLRGALAEEGSRRAAAEAAAKAAAEGAKAAAEAAHAAKQTGEAAARAALERELAEARAGLETARAEVHRARQEAERLRTELEEARARLAGALVERERLRTELVTEPTQSLPAAPPAPVEMKPVATSGQNRELLSDECSSPSIPPAEGDGGKPPIPEIACPAPAKETAPAPKPAKAEKGRKVPKVAFFGFGPALSGPGTWKKKEGDAADPDDLAGAED